MRNAIARMDQLTLHLRRGPMGRALVACAGLVGSMTLLTACYPGQYPIDFFREMHYQPYNRLLEAERRSPPPDAVPVTGGQVSVTFEQARTMQSPTSRSEQRLAQGQQLFNTNCVACHGADARGTGMIAERFAAASANPPADLTSQRVRSRTDGEIHWIITNGMGNMPPFGDLMTDDQRWAVVQAVRNMQGQ